MNDNKRLKELINQIPHIRENFHSFSVGGVLMNMIFKNPEFIAWKNRVLVELENRPSSQSIEDIRRTLSKMNGWNDESDFEDVTSRIYAMVECEEYSEEVSVEVNLNKGTVVFSAFNVFTLVKLVGAGGNGRVWSATDKDGKSVALKFIERNDNEKVLKRFKNETFFCMSHKHPNILPVLDYGTAGNKYIFYVMPLFAVTLRDRIKMGINPEEACKIFTGILEGLSFAHKLGTIHRDIKPENILFEEDSSIPVIADFGIAHFSADNLVTFIETKRLDRMANFQYSAPEQRKKGGVVTPQTDIYAAGLILNEMFTGEIAQASGYKKIGDVASEYGYLDKLFSEMFKQEANERIYPESNIINQMWVLAEIQKNEIEVRRLRELSFELQKPEEYNPMIISVKYENEKLLFELNQNIISDWFQILANGLYSHSAISRYETQKLLKYNINTIAMPMHVDEQESTIKNIVKNVKEWIILANGLYKDRVIRQMKSEQCKKEQSRRSAINQLEKVNNINAFLSSIQ